MRFAVLHDQIAETHCGLVESAVAPRTLTVTDNWIGYGKLRKREYEHLTVVECGEPEIASD